MTLTDAPIDGKAPERASESLASQAGADEGSFQTGAVTTVMLGHAVHDTYTAFLPPLLPVLIERYTLSNAQAGMLSVFMQWPSLLQPFIGYVADRRNLRWLFIATPTLTAVCMSLLPVAPSYAIMAFLLMIVGVSAAALHAVGAVIAGNLSGRSLGRGMGLWMMGGGLGYTIGPLIIVAAISVLQPEGVPWLMIAGLVTSLALYGRLRGTSSMRGLAAPKLNLRDVIVVLRPILFPVIGIAIVRSFMAAALSTFLPVFLRSEGNSLWFAGGALAFFEAAGMVGSLTAGTISDRVGRRKILTAAMLLASPLMLVFLLASGPIRLVIILAVGFTALSVMPVMLALMQELFPQGRAMANGFYLGLSFLTNAAATLALGLMADAWGIRVAFAVCAVMPLLGVPLVRLLPSKRVNP